MAVSCPIDLEAGGYFSWIPIVMLFFTIVFLLLSLFYMLSKFFSRPDWEARFKVELARMVISLFFVFGILSFAVILCIATSSITEGADPFDTAKTFMAGFALRDIPKNLAILWNSAIMSRVESTLITPLPSCIAGVCYNSAAGAFYIATDLEAIANIMLPIAASLVIQMVVLDVIKQFFLSLLLPAGFLLKILPVTRDAGAYLIAAALSFYFVFPMVYVMGDLIHKEIGKGVLKDLENTVSSMNLGDPYSFDEGESLKAVTALAYVSPFALTLPLLAVILSLASARVLYSVFSKEFIGEVGM
jgi:hypothetical protein